jgi:hypothetical protein
MTDVNIFFFKITLNEDELKDSDEWYMAKRFGAECSSKMNQDVTHVVVFSSDLSSFAEVCGHIVGFFEYSFLFYFFYYEIPRPNYLGLTCLLRRYIFFPPIGFITGTDFLIFSVVVDLIFFFGLF